MDNAPSPVLTLTEDRVGFRARRTRKLHDEYITYEAFVERTRPSGIPVAEALDGMREEVDDSVERAFALSEQSGTIPPSPTTTIVPLTTLSSGMNSQSIAPPNPSPHASHSQSLDSAKATTTQSPQLVSPKLRLVDYASGRGSWCFSNSPEAALLFEALRKAPKKTLTIDGFTYKLSGLEDKFIARFPHREAEV